MYSNQPEELKELFTDDQIESITYDQILDSFLEEPCSKSISLIKEAYENAKDKNIFTFALIYKLAALHSKFCKTA